MTYWEEWLNNKTKALCGLKMGFLHTGRGQHSLGSHSVLPHHDEVWQRKVTKLPLLTDANAWRAAINLSVCHSRLIILPSQRALLFIDSCLVDFEISFGAKKKRMKSGSVLSDAQTWYSCQHQIAVQSPFFVPAGEPNNVCASANQATVASPGDSPDSRGDEHGSFLSSERTERAVTGSWLWAKTNRNTGNMTKVSRLWIKNKEKK